MAGAAKQLTPSLEKAGEAIKRFAAKLKPQVDYDLADQSLCLTFGTSAKRIPQTLPLLTDVLNIIDRMATVANKRAAVILDEFQQIIDERGATAERHIRGTVQRHRHTAYVFAGSKTDCSWTTRARRRPCRRS